MLEIAVFEIELPIAVVFTVAIKIAAGGLGFQSWIVVCHQITLIGPRTNNRLPACRTAICAHAHLLAGLIMDPFGTCRLDKHSGVKTNLLMSGRTVMIMRKNNAETPMHALCIDHWIEEPALNGCSRTEPVLGASFVRLRKFEGVCFVKIWMFCFFKLISNC